MQFDSERYRPTVIVTYNPEWPKLYEKEASSIALIIGEHVKAIHHIGSTSIEGLAAKPVIDIMVVFTKINLLNKCKEKLEDMGYHWIGEGGIPGRQYLWRQDKNGLYYHLQCFQYDHVAVSNCIVFRDYLRAHPAKALQYSKIKMKAAEKHPNDTHAYAEYKSDYVAKILEEALIWQKGQAYPK